jgi:hypothetical protein
METPPGRRFLGPALKSDHLRRRKPADRARLAMAPLRKGRSQSFVASSSFEVWVLS